MSNYVVKNYAGLGVDKNLTEIFQPIGSTTPAANATNYKQGGSDLNTIFAKLVSGSPAASTSYVVKDYNGIPNNNLDLKDIFQHDPLLPYITIGTVITAQTAAYVYTISNSHTIAIPTPMVGSQGSEIEPPNIYPISIL